MASTPEEIAGRFRVAAALLANRLGRLPASQEEWGEMLGVSQQTFHNYLHGKSFQRFAAGERVARTLNVSPGWLFFGEGEGPTSLADAADEASSKRPGRRRG